MNVQARISRYYEKYMFVVGIFGQAVFYAQALKIYSTQSADDVSMVGFSFGLVSVSSWLIYGMLLKNRVLIISNIIAVIGAAMVILGILLYG